LGAVIAGVEGIKGEKWEQFRERYGDRGRDLVLYLGRKHCGLKLDELAQAAGLGEYASVAMAVKRYEARLRRDQKERARLKAVSELLNVKM
jgi:hypothetical protein